MGTKFSTRAGLEPAILANRAELFTNCATASSCAHVEIFVYIHQHNVTAATTINTSMSGNIHVCEQTSTLVSTFSDDTLEFRLIFIEQYVFKCSLSLN